MEGCTRLADGRYVVRLPLRPGMVESLGDTLRSATKLMERMQVRLDHDATLKKEYTDFLREYGREGQMRCIAHLDRLAHPTPLYYLPHHQVWKRADSRRKLRLVFNASSRSTTGISLNDVLYTGPPLQRDLSSIILLRQLAQDEGLRFPLAAKSLLQDTFVDDIITGCDDEQSAFRLRDELMGLLRAGGFSLKKWVSNRSFLLEGLPTKARLRPTCKEFANEGPVHALGIFWDPVRDEFRFAAPSVKTDQCVTKRQVLSTIAQLYDPIGWLGPLTVTAKIILQDLWKNRGPPPAMAPVPERLGPNYRNKDSPVVQG